MPPIWLRTTYRDIEIAMVVALLGLGALLLYEGVRLGPGWGESGPLPGFFPFALTCLLILGTLGVIYVNIYRHPKLETFFEAQQEVTDLLKVGLPILVVVALMRWLGMYISAGLYLGFFMSWYGGFRWYSSLLGAILLPVIMWLTLRQGFNISMPMSVFYKTNILPF